jgi:hypothetical protein
VAGASTPPRVAGGVASDDRGRGLERAGRGAEPRRREALAATAAEPSGAEGRGQAAGRAEGVSHLTAARVARSSLAAVSLAAPRFGSGEWLCRPARPSSLPRLGQLAGSRPPARGQVPGRWRGHLGRPLSGQGLGRRLRLPLSWMWPRPPEGATWGAVPARTASAVYPPRCTLPPGGGGAGRGGSRVRASAVPSPIPPPARPGCDTSAPPSRPGPLIVLRPLRGVPRAAASLLPARVGVARAVTQDKTEFVTGDKIPPGQRWI